ncbi:MAG: PQQ-binding-like beta-propeller repeat protein [Polyangiaceae bacterium]
MSTQLQKESERMRSHPSRHWILLPVFCTTLVASIGCDDGAGGGGGANAPSVPLEGASPWPKFRANAAQDGRSAVHPTKTGGALWSFPTGKGIFSSPVVGADGTVYVGSADRTFYAINEDGTLRWSLLTGEIIDSSALLDDKGRVYFGSGDGKLRALDAKTGTPIWQMDADPPSTNSAFINWFEGNVAIGPDGTLYVPNDNFFVYAVDRDSGVPKWRFKMPDQTWSLPAVDAKTGTLFIGNNNLLPLLGQNTFSILPDGSTNWSKASLGTVAASPLLTADGKMIVGGFDGYVRAYDANSGEVLWESATRDHVYASAALLPDGAIVAPSCDGTIYALEPSTGAVRWAFDTREPIRSSPAVDAEGNVYVGSGEGRLFVLGPDGKLRWSILLIADDRNDLNASPALGARAIYIAGESGEVFSVPYDYCLRPEAAADTRCATEGGEGLPDGASLLFTTSFGALRAADTIDKNQPLSFTLVVRENGDSRLAILDTSNLSVTVSPPAAIQVDVAGDGKFLTVAPKQSFVAGADGKVTVSLKAKYLVDLDRVGLKLSGGKPGGDVAASFTFDVRPDESYSLPLPIPAKAGDPAAVWEVSRVALPLPTIMPSYNQIGFDSLHYLIGAVEGDGKKGVAWMIGAKLQSDENVAVVDPASKALLPLSLTYDGGALTLANQDGLGVEVMNVVIPFRTFRIAGHLGADGGATESGIRIHGSTTCAGVPTYGAFLQTLGLCNPQTDVLSVFGGANLRPYAGGSATAPSGLGTVQLSVNGTQFEAAITGGTLKLADHVAAILVVDAATGDPVTFDYGLATERATAADGTLTAVRLPRGDKTLPAAVRAYLMIDTYPAASATLTVP